MSLNSAYLQSLIDALNLSDTSKINLAERLGGSDFTGGKGDALLALLLAVSYGGGGGAVTIADGADVTLGAIADAAAAAGGTGTISAKLRLITSLLNSLLTNTPAGSARTLTSSAPTTGGTIAAGAKSVAVMFSSDFVGTFNGQTASSTIYPGGKSISVINPNDTLPAIVYTISAGTMYLDVLT